MIALDTRVSFQSGHTCCMLVNDIKWYIWTCHEYQICQTTKLHIPPTIPLMDRLFHKVHIDTMVMP